MKRMTLSEYLAVNVDWDACNEFDRYPAFGEPCKTCKVLFVSQ